MDKRTEGETETDRETSKQTNSKTKTKKEIERGLAQQKHEQSTPLIAEHVSGYVKSSQI